MKEIILRFEDKEFKELEEAKEISKADTWERFIMWLFIMPRSKGWITSHDLDANYFYLRDLYKMLEEIKKGYKIK